MANLVCEAARLRSDNDVPLHGQRSYTFREPDRLGANFAIFLFSRDVQKGDRITFSSSKSASRAIPRCLKPGPIYVSVEWKLPPDRLLFIGEVDDDRIFGRLPAVFKHELPYSMIPSLDFLFDHSPKLPSGKTDKKQILTLANRCINNSVNKGLTRFVGYEEVMCDRRRSSPCE